MRTVIYLVLANLILLLTSCLSNRSDAQTDEYSIESETGDFSIFDDDDDVLEVEEYKPRYFPKEMSGAWYDKHLDAMEEVSIYKLRDKKDIEAYRFIYLPSFGNPMSIRFSKVDGDYFVRAVKLSGKGGYGPGKIAKLQIFRLKEGDFPNDLRELLPKVLWPNLPEKSHIEGSDGSRWILEGLKDGKYAVKDIWTPDCKLKHRELENFVKLCQMFASLGKVGEIKHVYDRDLLDPLDSLYPLWYWK